MANKQPKGQQVHANLAEERKRTEERRVARLARRAAKRAEKTAAANGVVVPAGVGDLPYVLPPSEPPSFWFGYDVPWAKVVSGRVVFFALLALDALLAIQHAPRYGAGEGFNVAQLPFLDHHAADREQYAVYQGVLAYLFVLAACGVGTRFVVPIGAAIYGYLYFGSQLDSYQHHYLVFLLLVIASFVPWQRPAPPRVGLGVDGRTPVRTWALRLFLVQLGVLYLYAAISKIDHAWLDGTTLGMQLPAGTSLRGLIDNSIGITAVAKLVIATELVLAATVWVKPAQMFVAPIGILFHIGIIVTGFEIGLFAWIMLGVYVFVIPDGVWAWLGDNTATRWVVWMVRRTTSSIDGTFGFVIGGLCVLAAWLFARSIRIPYASEMVWVALLGVVPAAWYYVKRRGINAGRGIAWMGVASLIAVVVALVVDARSTTARDYYKFWGGSARRLGDTKGAIEAYEGWIGIDENDPVPHYQLGRLLIEKDAKRGLEELHRSQKLDSSHARAYVAEAKWLQSQGKTSEALAKAQEATYAEPGDQSAQALVKQLGGGGGGGSPVEKPDDRD